MNDHSNDERRLFRTQLVTLHAVVELAIKKGIFTREEFSGSCQWFDQAFEKIDALAKDPANRDLNQPSSSLQAVYDEIKRRLFEHG